MGIQYRFLVFVENNGPKESEFDTVLWSDDLLLRKWQ
jgi:hypothetical protein